jgi:hypothetical protein
VISILFWHFAPLLELVDLIYKYTESSTQRALRNAEGGEKFVEWTASAIRERRNFQQRL